MGNKTAKTNKTSIFHPTRFNLTLFYSITSFLVIAIVSFSVGKLIASIEKRELIERSETYAGFIIRNLNYAMYKEFFFPVIEAEGRIDLENNTAHFTKLDDIIKNGIYGYNIKKVYLYDYNRQIIYSTVPKHVGFELEEGENPQLDAALNGVATSILRPAGMTDYRGEIVSETLLESYYPICEFLRETTQPKQVGAMEIYQDMKGLNQQIAAAQRKTIIVTASSMGILFVSLLLIVNKGASIIRLRTRQLIEAKDQMEERVRERTREIEATYGKLQQTQRQLIQSEKMAGIGKLAAGLAHEINNPLASVLSCAEGLLERFNNDVGEEVKRSGINISPDNLAIFPEYLKIICKETFRCKSIISKLLNFSRQIESVLVELDVNTVVSDAVLLIKHQIDQDKKRIMLDIAPAPIVVTGDEHQLKQVFLNILINASEAIEEEGEIMVKTGKRGDSAFIVFKDSGCGIAQEDLKKVFDPFFTTKPVGKGTGLGLSICYGIVEAHNGSIEAYSDGPGKGAIIEVTLPCKDN